MLTKEHGRLAWIWFPLRFIPYPWLLPTSRTSHLSKNRNTRRGNTFSSGRWSPKNQRASGIWVDRGSTKYQSESLWQDRGIHTPFTSLVSNTRQAPICCHLPVETSFICCYKYACSMITLLGRPERTYLPVAQPFSVTLISELIVTSIRGLFSNTSSYDSVASHDASRYCLPGSRIVPLWSTRTILFFCCVIPLKGAYSLEMLRDLLFSSPPPPFRSIQFPYPRSSDDTHHRSERYFIRHCSFAFSSCATGYPWPRPGDHFLYLNHWICIHQSHQSSLPSILISGILSCLCWFWQINKMSNHLNNVLPRRYIPITDLTNNDQPPYVATLPSFPFPALSPVMRPHAGYLERHARMGITEGNINS